MTPYSEPRQATQVRKSVGSVTIPASARSPRRTSAVPPAPEDSSSVLVATIRSPASVMPAARDGLGGERHRRHAALHVAGAAPVEPAVADLGGERVAGPLGLGLARDDVDVAVEQQAAAAAGAAQRRDELGAPGEVQPLGHQRRARQLAGVGLEQVDLRARRAQARRRGAPAAPPPRAADRRPRARWCRTRPAPRRARRARRGPRRWPRRRCARARTRPGGGTLTTRGRGRLPYAGDDGDLRRDRAA